MRSWLRLPRQLWGLTRYRDCIGGIDYISSYRSAPRDDSLSGGWQIQCGGNISQWRKQWLHHLSSNLSDNMKGLPQQTACMIAEAGLCRLLVPNLREQDRISCAALHLDDKLLLILYSKHKNIVSETLRWWLCWISLECEPEDTYWNNKKQHTLGCSIKWLEVTEVDLLIQILFLPHDNLMRC